MNSDPKYYFGTSFAIFFHVSSGDVFQQHVASQIILGLDHDIHVLDEDDQEYSGRIVLIKPLVKSNIQCEGHYKHLFLSPTLGLTSDIIALAGEADIHILADATQLPFNIRAPRAELITALNRLDATSIERLDPRLLAVLEDLNQNLENPSILEAAKRSGLSRSRVRTLAREQMGIPLSNWVTWRKLVKSNKALSDGANLSEAAMAGHFSDQAHFSRTMKKMFGVTPTQASRVYS